MDNHTVVVLAAPNEPQLGMLEELPPETTIAAGNAAQAFERAAPDADVIFNWSGSGALLREVFGMCPRVQWVHSRAAGLDSQLFPDLVASPAVMTNGSGVFSPPLGEFALAAILYFAKDFRRMIRSQQAGIWDQFDITEIAGQTAGIVGYGDIGRAVAARLKPMGLDVLAMKRHGPPLYHVDPLVSRIFGPEARLEMMARCDYVVVSAPLTPETKGMIGAAEFAAMKPTAVVINVGRGPVIDEAALIDALRAGRIKGAALDVFDTEPLPAGHPFYSLENLLLSPHCSDHTPDWLERAMRFFLDQFERFRKHEPLRSVVNKQLGY
ncbi:MAG TPA: D-2-hydroxyacid dehydrogenase [Bryobacteraceae bacterium]|nr:D-2-hydroxyacid dehydrogenase [Bryobacteraceae bacterium]